VEAALAICRLLHFAATMLLFGAGAFVWALVQAPLSKAIARPIRRLVAAAIVVAAVTAIAWLALEAGQMGEGWRDSLDPEAIGAVAFDTAFGRVWIWRIALALILLVALALGRHDRWLFVVPASALLLASLGLVGHAAMQSDVEGALHRVNDSVHLLCAGAWLGGLPPLILCLRHHADARLRADAGVALRRFSGLGHFVVALVVLTGGINAALTLGKWPLDFSSPYQRLLVAKVAIVAIMITLALVNRYVLVPRIRNGAGGPVRALTINSVAEIALGAVALALVSVFAMFAPV
jgi:putative copper resistance protein D